MNIESKRSAYERFLFKYMGGDRGVPDLLIPLPKGRYSGLFIELKTENRRVFKPNGELFSANKETHAAQVSVIKRLFNNGYYADMVFGFESAKNLIDTYLSSPERLKYPSFLTIYPPPEELIDSMKSDSELVSFCLKQPPERMQDAELALMEAGFSIIEIRQILYL